MVQYFSKVDFIVFLIRPWISQTNQGSNRTVALDLHRCRHWFGCSFWSSLRLIRRETSTSCPIMVQNSMWCLVQYVVLRICRTVRPNQILLEKPCMSASYVWLPINAWSHWWEKVYSRHFTFVRHSQLRSHCPCNRWLKMFSLVSFRFWRRPRIHVGMTHAHIIDRLECFCILVCLQYQISCRPCACRGVKVPEENTCTLANRMRSIDLHTACLSVTMFQSYMRSSLLTVNLYADRLCAFSVLDWVVIVVYQIRVCVMRIFLEEAGY